MRMNEHLLACAKTVISKSSCWKTMLNAKEFIPCESVILIKAQAVLISGEKRCLGVGGRQIYWKGAQKNFALDGKFYILILWCTKIIYLIRFYCWAVEVPYILRILYPCQMYQLLTFYPFYRLSYHFIGNAFWCINF